MGTIPCPSACPKGRLESDLNADTIASEEACGPESHLIWRMFWGQDSTGPV